VPTQLTPRERDVLTHLVLGLSNQEIASALFVSVNTVKMHAKGLYRKLGCRSRVEAVSMALTEGLVAGRFVALTRPPAELGHR
jgi:LuxR family maltose regulon positive regulatory protein